MRLLFILLMLFSLTTLAKPVNINKADAKTISKSLSGIGEKKAAAIVKYRESTAPFESLDDLRKVKGIGDKTIQKNKADILFSDKPAESTKKTEKAKKAK